MADGDNTATGAVDPNSLAALLQQTMTPNPDVQQQEAPLGGALQAPPPTQQPQVSSTPPNTPPRMGGMPLIAQYLQGMIRGGNQGGIGASGYPTQPQSRGDMTLNFLGEFLGNMAQGLSNAGHGPGANLRGAGAAIQAPYQRSLQDFNVQQQAQEQQARISQQQAQTQLEQAQAEQLKNVVQTPYGPMSQALWRSIAPAAIRAQTQEKTTQERISSQEGIAAANRTSKEGIQAKSLAEKSAEFRTTDDYRKWKENLDTNTRKQIAQLTAGKAPATLFQTATFAAGGLKTLNDAVDAMNELEAKGVFGKSWAQNKVENWIFGKGAVDPSVDADTRRLIGKARNAVDLTSSAMQKAHTGRGMKEMYDDFKKTHSLGQDWEVLRGAMDESKSLLTDYAGVASDENIRRIRGGTNNIPQPSSSTKSSGGFVKF